ncbi:FecR family protein [Methylomonas sp. MED-D]|uniref:FecR family protein n=1 Tax=unclassified Methylomonas TaxID=2608980 RepID=UPI0028A4EEB0|nr:FecR family protein [Methylomonas sp. MV1]MDT4332452.1 FecR family protein [Methylomonas sp. MV1]
MAVDPIPENVRRQAIDWLFRLHSDAHGADERQALADWLAESPEHQRAFTVVQSQWQSLRHLRHLPFPSKDAALRFRPPSRRHCWRLSTAAMALFACGVATFHPSGWLGFTASYHTAKGERKTIVLADDSRIELNTDSELSVHFNRWRRQVYLTRGEAFFKVAHAADRPFDVRVGNLHVLDVGTEFDVYNQSDRVQIAVLEGRVEILGQEPLTLAADQAVELTPDGTLLEKSGTAHGASIDWRSGQFKFRNRRLDQVLHEISRYHDVQFNILSPELAELTVSGVFNTDNLAGLLDALGTVLPVQVQRISPRQILIQRKS